jgi:hypothetical protein
MRGQIANRSGSCQRLEAVRYFFHVSDGERQIKDEVGRNFATPDAAKGHAAVIASELALDDEWEGYVVFVINEEGNEIARVPIHPS